MSLVVSMKGSVYIEKCFLNFVVIQEYVSLRLSEGDETRPKIQKLFEACRKADVKKRVRQQKTSAA